ncbi:hypothetical protein IQ238_27075 [Pleurocapsales cyanobacterium LEGE 06147]|nr:hypothetical protein [Pleurocapsales cyanobacterium LEGE 06147]
MHKIFTPKTNKVIFGLLAISTIGFSSLPVKADNAVIQETVQESYNTGKGNVSVQHSRQQNRQSSDYRDRYGYYENHNTGIVQRSQQYCDQFGEYNTCVQDAQQQNTIHNRRSRY